MAELAFSYATILKQEKQEDGTLKVYGKATDDSVDIDSQICDETWLQQAMPQWFETGGNIREQHSNIAAGVATDYELKSDGHYITAHVVDPVSVKKVEAGVLKGFSIGIRSPRIIRDNKAANGRIVDGQIVEVSLVDRPANPNAKLMLAKAADNGDLEMVKQVSIPTPASIAPVLNKFNENHDESGRFASSDGGSSTAGADTHATLDGVSGAGAPGDNAGFGEHITNLQTGLETLNSHFNAIAAREGRDVAPHEKAMLESNREHLNDALTALRNGNSEGARGYLNIAAASINRIAGSMGSRGANSDEIAAAEGIGRQAYAATTASDNKGADADLAKFNENHDEGGRFASSDNSGITNAKNSLSQATRIVNRINENSPESRAAKTNAKLSLDEARRRIDEAQNHAANSKPNEASAALHFASQQIMYVADALRNVDSASEMKLRGHSYDIGQAAINTRANKGADADLAKFNDAHDESGRFASSDGGGGAASGGAASVKAMSDAHAQMTEAIDGLKEIQGIGGGSSVRLDQIKEGQVYLGDAQGSLDEAKDALAAGDHGAAWAATKEANDLFQQGVGMLHLGFGGDLGRYAGRVGQFENAMTFARLAAVGLGKSATVGNTDTKVETMTNETVNTEKSVVTADIKKFDEDLFNTAIKALGDLIAVEAGEAAEGHDESDSIKHLLKAIKHLKKWYQGEVAEGEVANPNPAMLDQDSDVEDADVEPEEIYLSADKAADEKPAPGEEKPVDGEEPGKCDKCDKAEGECKCADKSDKSATLDLAVDDAVTSTIIEKAVQSAKQAVEAELEQLKSVTAVAEQRAVELEAQLTDALSKAAAGGPVRSGIKTKSVNVDDLLVKAAEFRNKASLTQDRTLSDGYRELAEDLEKKARKGRK